LLHADDSQYTVESQPGLVSEFQEGSVALASGFSGIQMNTGWAIDSLFSVGAQTGVEVSINCPPDMLVTGIAGGAYPKIVSTILARLRRFCTLNCTLIIHGVLQALL
jgi:hypothetical protein